MMRYDVITVQWLVNIPTMLGIIQDLRDKSEKENQDRHDQLEIERQDRRGELEKEREDCCEELEIEREARDSES
jgi:hypothetical protein